MITYEYWVTFDDLRKCGVPPDRGHLLVAFLRGSRLDFTDQRVYLAGMAAAIEAAQLIQSYADKGQHVNLTLYGRPI